MLLGQPSIDLQKNEAGPTASHHAEKLTQNVRVKVKERLEENTGVNLCGLA